MRANIKERIMATTSVKRLREEQAKGSARDYARQVWLAGLGAFSQAEKEGSKFFEMLVKRGEKVEIQARKRAEKKVEEMKGRMEEMRGRANDSWNKLEQVFQDRVARALNRLGVPNHDDVEALSRQMEELSKNVAELVEVERSKSLPVPKGVAAPATVEAA
jgi:poly(hydroxyalkanoate) granule-associated protein